ncbi:cytochrome P450 [Nocardia terpenica]|uniref:cytochrome P450 n=1 Tax=Nocardia terpenica TaxID=455432 RepID=UPI00189446CF|nr:cytochrome P450 [Nocardia terpenica]MBF6063931.1 cytochrome P450 [Nocardia terpenica]MBF6107833.1 cytochrome P450 [Nocardia terpenica]MBF6114901.1 cytochrome P450 [Nocardia terpenica]MBF6121112.1 cytochrome P450 [Nocardia terpenica]MBF6153346.1 cytochrome P450 [Nocardia terpenica]
MYTAEFAADPHRVYRELRRRYGSLAPVELAPGVPATLVVGYRTAVRILNDPEHFPADPRAWQKTVPADSPVLPMLEWRPNAQRSAGLEHIRYRQANVESIADVDLHALHGVVERIAVPLINAFCEDGGADLVSQYAFPLAFESVNALLGCPPEIGWRIAAGQAAVWEGVDADEGNRTAAEAVLELVRLKRSRPGEDIVSRLVAHPTRLSDEELSHQIVTLYGAGIEPQRNLIANALRLLLTDDRFASGVHGGSLPTHDALDEVLFTDPPGANYCVSYPRQPIVVDDVWLPAHQPVVVSMAACNNDPAVGAREFTDNRSHLAWSVGPHSCPARSPAYLIAQGAIDQLLDALPEMRLAVPDAELAWRPGPFHRALAALPVVFPVGRPLTVP